jgi:hypothetical protein
MRRILAAFACLALLAAAPAARATSTVGPDYSDLWWNADESGWGAHITQQDDVVFMVLYVYDAERRPRFFVASDMLRAAPASGDTFEGTLYSTSGPAFTGPFDPAQVALRAVGTARLRFDSPGDGTLSYTVGEVAVEKAITRQSWRSPELAGEYRGGLFGTATAMTCPLGLPTIAYPGSFRVSQAGDQVTIDTTFNPGFASTGTCRMTGRLSQQGSLASISEGAYECEFVNGPLPVAGTFELTAIEWSESGLGGRYKGREGASCVHEGHFGGIRRVRGVDTPEPEPEPEY